MWPCFKIFLGLILVVTSTEGYCCSRNENNSSCCGVQKCNIFCCNCDHGGWRDDSAFNTASIKSISSQPSPAGVANAQISSRRRRRKRVALLMSPMPTHTLNRNQIPIQANRNMDAALDVYNTIDVNRDSLINYDEALSYFRNVTGKIRMGNNNDGAAATTVKTSDYEFSLDFNEMDTNHDGVLEPHEFDNSLPV